MQTEHEFLTKLNDDFSMLEKAARRVTGLARPGLINWVEAISCSIEARLAQFNTTPDAPAEESELCEPTAEAVRLIGGGDPWQQTGECTIPQEEAHEIAKRHGVEIPDFDPDEAAISEVEEGLRGHLGEVPEMMREVVRLQAKSSGGIVTDRVIVRILRKLAGYSRLPHGHLSRRWARAKLPEYE